VTIANDQASKGSIIGKLPRRPTSIQVYPAEEKGSGLFVFTAKAEDADRSIDTVRGRAKFLFDPRHATDIIVFEAPGVNNNWERLVVRINSMRVSAFLVEWED